MDMTGCFLHPTWVLSDLCDDEVVDGCGDIQDLAQVGDWQAEQLALEAIHPPGAQTHMDICSQSIATQDVHASFISCKRQYTGPGSRSAPRTNRC